MSIIYSIILFKVQCRMFCSKKSYCDFVVWLENDVHIEKIYPDEYFWSKAKKIFSDINITRTFWEILFLYLCSSMMSI